MKSEIEEIIKDLKWFRDEYLSPEEFSARYNFDIPARKLLCTIMIDFLERGKNSEVIDKYKETFFRLIKRAQKTKNNK